MPRTTVRDPKSGVTMPTVKAARKDPTRPTQSNGKRGTVAEVVKKRQGIVLDVGCGDQKYPGSVGMDHQDLPGVDIVHSWDEFPWPFEDESVLTIIASHVVEHVDPARGHFLDWMNECWRVLKVGGQLAIVTPYAGSTLFWADPSHCNGCNEATWAYFDPGSPSGLFVFYKPKPFWMEMIDFRVEGVMEVVLRKREDKAEYREMRRDDIPQVVVMPGPER